jgi:hypothetical protein
MSRNGKSKLEKKVLKFRPLRDEDNRRYVPFCDYGWHQGIIKYPDICERRHCKHYYRFYFDQKKADGSVIPENFEARTDPIPQCNY